MDSGLLIVNADDYGATAVTSDSILECMLAGAVTSTTAMVFMSHSAVAAGNARKSGINAIGLHLNFTEPFDAPDVPADVRQRQAALCRHFAPLARRRWTYSVKPSLRHAIRDCIDDQVREFLRLYGHEPTHFDGHHHAELCPDIFLSSRFPPFARGRRAPVPRQSRGAMRLLRAVRQAAVTRRIITTDVILDFAAIHPTLGGEGLQVLDSVRHSTVEILCHPGVDNERQLLLTDGWRSVVSSRPHGSFAALAVPGNGRQ